MSITTSTLGLRADWDELAAVISAVGSSPIVTAMVACLTNVDVDEVGDPVDPNILLKVTIRIPAGADWRTGQDFTVTLPHTPFDVHAARREILVELAKRGFVDHASDFAVTPATSIRFRTCPFSGDLTREGVLERLSLIGKRTGMSMRTFSSYVAHEKPQVPQPVRYDGAHPIFSAVDVDRWAFASPQGRGKDVRPRKRRVTTPQPADAIERFKRLPPVDAERFRRDVDAIVDPSL